MRPSELKRLKSLSLHERLAINDNEIPKIVALSKTALHPPTALSLDRPLFQPSTSKIVLQNYTVFTEYRFVLKFRNIDKCPRNIRIEPLSSKIFSIHGCSENASLASKVAAGMETAYTLIFHPTSVTDCSLNLVCITDRETFLIPVQSYSSTSIIDIDDYIRLENGLVRYRNTKAVLIQNTGANAVSATLTCSEGWSIEPSIVILNPASNLQLEISCFAQNTGSFPGEMTVQYPNGEKVLVDLMIDLSEINVSVGKHLELKQTYMAQSSENRLVIRNESEFISQYKFKTFPNVESESVYKRKILASLGVEEINSDEFDILERKKMERAMNLLENNELLFESPVITIEPRTGTLWPESEMEVQVIFKPEEVGSFATKVFLEVDGRKNRFEVSFTGESLGPHAEFSVDCLDVSEIYINEQYSYEVLLENNGNVDLNYCYIRPSDDFQNCLEISPLAGKLSIGQKQKITIALKADFLGEFSEKLIFELVNSPSPAVLSLRGSVVGPTFRLNKKKINFGECAFGFKHSNSFEIQNTSLIGFAYKLRKTFADEIDVTLSKMDGFLSPNQTDTISLSFLPSIDGFIRGSIFFDLTNIQENVYSVDVEADVIVPKVSVTQTVIDFGDCYVNYKYRKEIELVNKSCYPAIFHVPAQEDSAKTIFFYECTPSRDILHGTSSLNLIITLEARRLGKLAFPIFVYIEGESVPICIDLVAVAKGPLLIPSTSELNFGKLKTLTKHTKEIELRNVSPISASFQIMFSEGTQVFSANIKSATVPPNETAVVYITAHLDDSIAFNDIMKITIGNAHIQEVRCFARGYGSTIEISGLNEKLIDFGRILLGERYEKKLMVQNRGRRIQYVTWNFDSQYDQSAFTITPNKFGVRPSQTVLVSLCALSEKPKSFIAMLSCFAHADRNLAQSPIHRIELKAAVLEPKLIFTPPTLDFYVESDANGKVSPLVAQCTMENITGLTLTPTFRSRPPFEIHCNSSSALKTHEIREFKVYFDPRLQASRLARREKGQILIGFKECGAVIPYNLESFVSYPTLQYESEQVDFGEIAIKSAAVKFLKVWNTSSRVVDLNWDIKSDSIHLIESLEISPLSCKIYPSEEKTFEIHLVSRAEGSITVEAQCNIIGGQSGSIHLKAHGKSLQFEVDTNILKIGEIPFNRIVSKKITIINKGKAPLSYRCVLPSNPNRFLISPAIGIIEPETSIFLEMKYCPMTIGQIADDFVIEFDRERLHKVSIQATATFLSPTIPLKKISGFESSQSLEKLMLRFGIPMSPGQEAQNIELRLSNHVALLSKEYETECELPSTTVGSKLLFLHSKRKPKSSLLTELNAFCYESFLWTLGEIYVGERFTKNILIENLQVEKLQMKNLAELEEVFDMVISNVNDGIRKSLVVSLTPKTDTPRKISRKILFDISGGPRVSIDCQLSVIYPDLRISAEILNFTEVYVGQRKKKYINIENVGVIDCQWQVLKKADCKAFSVSPTSGTLAPGEIGNLEAIFEPREAKIYQSQLTLEAHSVKYKISLKGSGSCATLDIQPNILDFGVVLPHSDTIQKNIPVRNTSTIPLGLVIPEFDRAFQFDLMFTGENNLKKQFFNLNDYISGMDIKHMANLSNQTGVDHAKKRKSWAIFVLGPPYSGKSTVAKLISKRIGAELIKINSKWSRNSSNECHKMDEFSYLLSSIKERKIPLLKSGIVFDGYSATDILTLMDLFSDLTDINFNVKIILLRVDVLTCKRRSLMAEKEEKSEIESISSFIKTIDEDLYHDLPIAVKNYIDDIVNSTRRRKTARKQVTDDTEEKKKRHFMKRKPPRSSKSSISVDRLSSPSKDDDLSSENIDVSTRMDNLVKIYEKNAEFIDLIVASKKNKATSDGSKRRLFNASPGLLSTSGIDGLATASEENIAFDFASIEIHEIHADKALGELTSEIDTILENISVTPTMDHFEDITEIRFPSAKIRTQKRFLLEWDQTVARVTTSSSGSHKVIAPQLIDDNRSRSELLPNECRHLNVKFIPFSEGEYQHTVQLQSYLFHLDSPIVLKALVTSPDFVLTSLKDANLFRPEKAFLETSKNFFFLNFGNVFIRKSRDKMNKQHRAVLTMENISKHDCLISITQQSNLIFFTETSSISLLPGEMKQFEVFCVPSETGLWEERMLLCIKDNPRVKVLKITARAIIPEIEISSKLISFDKIIVGKTCKKELAVVNKTKERIHFRVCSEGAPDPFEISPYAGKLAAEKSEKLIISFRSSKPLSVRKAFRIEYSDDETFASSYSTETIIFTAEAYDLFLDIHLPKGSDSGIDFGLCNVGEESRQTFSLRNKGKYDVKYRFTVLKQNDKLSVNPEQFSIITAQEKAQTVTVILKASKPFNFKDESWLKCDIIDPSTEQIIRSPTIKITGRVEYPCFELSPSDLQFGQLTIGSRQHKQITVTNTGPLDVNFILSGDTQNVRFKDNISSSISKNGSKKDSIIVGPFTITPSFGSIQVGTRLVLNVEMRGELTSNFDETIYFCSQSTFNPVCKLFFKCSGEVVLPRSK